LESRGAKDFFFRDRWDIPYFKYDLIIKNHNEIWSALELEGRLRSHKEKLIRNYSPLGGSYKNRNIDGDVKRWTEEERGVRAFKGPLGKGRGFKTRFEIYKPLREVLLEIW